MHSTQRRLNPIMQDVVKAEVVKFLDAGIVYAIADSKRVSPVQMLEGLACHKYFCYLDGYSGFFQISIHPDDQEKTTFICPYESIMEVFVDDLSVYGTSFDTRLINLTKVLKSCEECNLVLHWESVISW
ncbi:uncharacterized protein [Spinacia oleracea]|uniref:Reverse transcriptase domain-containing protein n=1 Tax=Spinacia oleracea TaxID=3562 RepID=A0ABM3R9E3_SPIOL|nr:uncharacterized protein LOC130467663 [Spinacia oleracea]